MPSKKFKFRSLREVLGRIERERESEREMARRREDEVEKEKMKHCCKLCRDAQTMLGWVGILE